MPYYVAQQGDTLDRIAHHLGVSRGDIWEASENQALRERRGDGHILHPGDVLFYPEPEPPLVESLQIGSENAFRATVPMSDLALTVSHNSEPVANQPFVVEAEGQRVEGTSDGEGAVTFALRVSSRHARLSFPSQGLSYELDVGGLDPQDEISGVQARLRQLGFFGGVVDGRRGAQLSQALLRFQQAHGLTETGEPDAETRERLVEAYGC